jgi:hypothetical protein
MAVDDSEFQNYVRDNLAVSEAEDRGTAIPADTLAQIMQEIIKLDPELKNFVGSEIRTGFFNDEDYEIYTKLVTIAYHILLRGKQYGIPMGTTAKDILFHAKVRASASTSKGGKLLDTIVSSKKEIQLNMPSQKKKGLFSRK